MCLHPTVERTADSICLVSIITKYLDLKDKQTPFTDIPVTRKNEGTIFLLDALGNNVYAVFAEKLLR